MPNRYIRESLLTSPNFNKLSAEGERLFYRLLLLADDFGCFESTPEVVKGKSYALKFEVTVEDVKEALADLEKHEMIYTWNWSGRQYSVFRTFPKQNYLKSTHHRKTPPPPPDIESKLIEATEAWLVKIYTDRAAPPSKPVEQPAEPVSKPHKTNGEPKLDPDFARMVKTYEEGIGLLTPSTTERLRALSDEYSVEQFENAIKIAKEKGVYKLNYVEGILKNGEDRGHTSKPTKKYTKPEELLQD